MDLTVTLVFTAILAILQVPMGVAVGLRRARTGIAFMDGGDAELMRRMRAHGNFTENVPMALLALAGAEIAGTAPGLLWAAGGLLVAARLVHYAAIRGAGPSLGREAGAAGTSLVMLGLGAAILWRLPGG